MVAVEQPRLLGEPNRWHVRMKRGGAVPGIIAWCFSWKKYVFQPVHMAEFSADCLATLAAFLAQLRWERKSGLKPIDGLSPKTATKESK